MATPMQLTTVSLTVDEGVARLGLRRPDAANTVNSQMAAELRQVAIALRWDPAVRAVLLHGEGKVFCGGGDVAEFGDHGADRPQLIASVTADLHTAVLNLAAMDAPVIAAVTGSVGGAGLSLVAGCDLVVAGRRAKFTSAYTAVGLTPDGGGTYFLSRVVGLRRAMDLVLTNRVLTAEEAEAWGLVSRVVDDDMVHQEAGRLAAALAAGATGSLGEAKRLLLAGSTSDLGHALARESDTISRLSATPDAAEGIAAFLARRKPDFVGRAAADGAARPVPTDRGAAGAVTVFYNRDCSKCRGAVELLEARGVDIGLVEYLVAPPSRPALEAMVGKLLDPVADLVRTDDPAFKALGIPPEQLTSPGAVVSLLLEHPEVMQRPVVVRGDRAVIARPPERAAELLEPAP